MNFNGKAKRLDDIDLPKIGHLIGVGEDEVHAILDVESAGSGFDSQGRPKMLFEPHKFYAALKRAKLTKELNQAVAAGVAYEKWKKTGYPKDSYPRLLTAMAIHKEFALQSASWALPQIMGFNYRLAGYPSVEAMVTDFLDDEENHLKAMVNFINASGLADELRRHDWRGFENGYNGGGYNGAYAAKMKERFDHWQKIKDTPWSPEASQPAPQAPSPSPAPSQPAAPASPPAPAPVAPAKPVLTLGRVMAAIVALIVAAAGYFFKSGG